jgi:hypothetical protein
MSNLFWYPGHERILGDIVRAENSDRGRPDVDPYAERLPLRGVRSGGAPPGERVVQLRLDAVPSGRLHRGLPALVGDPLQAIGALLFEPGSSSGLVRLPARGLVEAMVRAVRRDGGVVLVNEVTTGVGRTRRRFGFPVARAVLYFSSRYGGAGHRYGGEGASALPRVR